ncbi:MAG: HD domain-containing protein [Anaerovoracaceae bacterium]|nr:HD domain-containing protein [Anaerovoracaceae bacterium]
MASERLTRQQCMDLLRDYGTPPHVVAHCRAVADVAVRLGRALNEHGYSIDIPLTENAALLHDIARVEDEHWNVGADYLESLGLHDQAAIVRQHMFYDHYSPVEELNAMDLVCIGDRTVKEHTYVGVDERFEYIMNKPRNLPPEARKRVAAKKEELKRLLEEIKGVTGCSLDELMGAG